MYVDELLCRVSFFDLEKIVRVVCWRAWRKSERKERGEQEASPNTIEIQLPWFGHTNWGAMNDTNK